MNVHETDQKITTRVIDRELFSPFAHVEFQSFDVPIRYRAALVGLKNVVC